MRLIFLHGLPGVGKLTIARELAELTGFRVFHNHLTVDLVLSVFEFGSKPFVELREAVWLEVFKQAAAADLNGLIFTFVFERTVRAGFIEKVQSVIDSAGGEVLFVELTCATEELEKRIEHPSRQKFGKLSSAVMFRELQASGVFAWPTLPKSHLVVDTTNRSASASARLIATELGLSVEPNRE